MMMFVCSLRDLVARRTFSPHAFIDDRRKKSATRLFGNSLLKFEPPKFHARCQSEPNNADNCYRVTLQLPLDMTLRQVLYTMKERVATVCGGGAIDKRGISFDIQKQTITFIVKPTYRDEASLPTGVKWAVASGTRYSYLRPTARKVA